MVAIRNRIAQLDRAEDHASIGIGHNTRQLAELHNEDIDDALRETAPAAHISAA